MAKEEGKTSERTHQLAKSHKAGGDHGIEMRSRSLHG